jgi:hypothetical protein
VTSAFKKIFLDTGPTVNYLGARAGAAIARTLRLVAFRKVRYSSGAFGPSELRYLGAKLWSDGIGSALADFVDRGEWSSQDAARVATLIDRDNAKRIYQLSG